MSAGTQLLLNRCVDSHVGERPNGVPLLLSSARTDYSEDHCSRAVAHSLTAHSSVLRSSTRVRTSAGTVAKWSAIVLLVFAAEVRAQSSSIYLGSLKRDRQAAEHAKSKGPTTATNVDRDKPLNPELEKSSLFAVQTKSPNHFRVHDVISVIVREQKRYKGKSKLETEREFNFESKIDAFVQMLNGHLAPATFTDGKPNIGLEMKSELEGEGRSERRDDLTFRMVVEVIDIKPNGLLVLAGKKRITVDREVQMMTFTGMCRSRDVSADNSILSTQVFDQVIDIQHSGALRDAAKRGWLTRLVDWLNPI